MNFRKKRYVTALLLGLALTHSGCGDDDDAPATTPPTTSLNAAAQAVVSAKSKIISSQVLSSASASSFGSLDIAPLAASDWTTAHLSTVAGEDCGDMTSPKGQLQELQNASCTTSPLFDLQNLMDIVCAVTGLVEVDDSGVPDVFSGNVTMTTEIAQSCGLDPAEVAGQEMPIAIEEVTGSDDYSRKITITTGSSRTIYWGRTTTEFSLSFMYTGGSTYKGFYFEDSADKSVLFELQAVKADAPRDVDFFRIHRDESVSPAVVTMVGSNTDLGNSNNIRWTLQGDTGGENDIAVSMVWDGQASGSGVDTCIDPSSFAASGTSAACGDYTAPAIAAFDSLMNSTFTSLTAQDDATYRSNFTEGDAVDFDDGNINSQAAIN